MSVVPCCPSPDKHLSGFVGLRPGRLVRRAVVLSTQRAHLTQSSHSFTSRIELVAATLVGLSSMAGCNMFLELSGATTRYNETRAALFKTRADASKVDEDEVDADVMITHREASMELNTSRKMSDLSLSSSSLVSDESERKEEESEQASAVQEEKLLEVRLSVDSKACMAGQPEKTYQLAAIAGRGWPRL